MFAMTIAVVVPSLVVGAWAIGAGYYVVLSKILHLDFREFLF
jgi:hypothetical protein